MEANEAHLIQLAQQIGLVGAKAANAYNEAQANLGLERVLTPARLSSREGTRSSLDTLEALSALTSAHEEAFAKFMTGAASQLVAVIAELPEQRAAELRESLVKSINWNLNAQGIFYGQRKRWIATAADICRFVESRRTSVSFSDDGLMFDRDDDLQELEQLVSAADELHRIEVAQTQERVARLKASLAVLGVR